MMNFEYQYSQHVHPDYKIIKVLVAFISFLCLSVGGFSQQPPHEAKIDPFFLSLLSKQTESGLQKEKKSIFCRRMKKNKNQQAKDSSSLVKYECIVYTRNAKSLREKNITINSELPGFVTAVVTLAQISEMARMPEVTYIEAPGKNQIH